MKKILAALFLVIAVGWAVYLYGFVRTATARSEPQSYQPDPQLEPWVERLQTLSASMRRQIDLIEHEAKKKAAMPGPGPAQKPIRNPFLAPA